MALWSISALAGELGLDRRTMKKRLDGLSPMETKRRKDGAVERFYELRRVIDHLGNPAGATANQGRELLALMVEGATREVCQNREWLGAAASKLVDEFGMDQQSAFIAVGLVAGLVSRGQRDFLMNEEATLIFRTDP